MLVPRASNSCAAVTRSALCACVDRVMWHNRITPCDANQVQIRNANPGWSGQSGSYLLRSGSERTALRGPLVHRADQAVFHHPGLEKRPDEFECTFIGHSHGHARHQAVVIDPLEKFFEIKVNHDVVARGNVSLRLGHRLIGGASRSEAVTVLGKCPVLELELTRFRGHLST